MKQKMIELQPACIWENFAKICAIPHPSKHEEQMVRFIISIAKKYNLFTYIDTAGNVIIRKPATTGYENLKTVTLQSHLDMVPQKNSDIAHNFVLDPIKPYIDGEWVTAENTTLGADNGIGVATILSLLEATDIPHGPLEALFTIDEEAGMTGVFNLDENMLQGEILINLDSEDEGELYVGCAGGVNTQATFHYKQSDTPDNYSCYTLTFSGFKGGHSGVDIQLERGNPNQETARLLLDLINEYEVEVGCINGGTLRNAIPREVVSMVAIPDKYLLQVKNLITKFETTLCTELANRAPDLKLTLAPTQDNSPSLEKSQIKNILKAIISCPNGVLRMSTEMAGVVESSSNMGMIKTTDETIEIYTLQRASHNSLRSLAAERVRHVFELAGAQVKHDGEYPGWVPELDSQILKIMKLTYEEMYNITPKVLVIHAGLECGIIHSKYPHMEMISLGPTICFPHSPDEKVNIKSVEKFWHYLLKSLTVIPTKV